MDSLAFDEVKLSDGRVLKLRESVGSDEMIVAAQLGDVFEVNGAGSVIFNTCLIARSIVSIDGKPIQSMRSYEEVRDFLGTVKGKDYKKIATLYRKLNNEDEGGNGLEAGSTPLKDPTLSNNA